MAGPQDWGAQPAPDDSENGPGAWGAVAAEDSGRDGGLIQNVPRAIALASSAGGRAQLWQGVKKLPADLLAGMLAQFETPGKAFAEGLSPDEEIAFAVNTAAMTIGTGGGARLRVTISRDAAKAAAPVMAAFDDGVMAPAAARLAAYARTGDPDGVRLEPPLPAVKPEPIAPIQNSPFAGVPRSIAARTGSPEVDAVLQSPVTQAVIDNPVVDRSHTVPYMAGGSTPLEDPTVYIDRSIPKTQTAPNAAGDGTVTFDPADPWIVHENVEQHTMELLIKNGMTDAEAYRVAHYEFAEPAEQAWYRAHSIDQAAAEKEQATWLPRIQHAAATDVPENLYRKPYPHADVQGAASESIAETRPSADEVARAKDIIRNAPELQPKSAAPLLQEARALGVIGGDKPEPPARESPVAQSLREIPPPRPMAANRTGDDKISMMPDGRTPIGDYEARFKQWIKKIDEPEDVRALIDRVATENEFFAEARSGSIAPAHVEKVAQAAGLDPTKIDRGGLSTVLDGPGKVRAVFQALRQTSHDFLDASERSLADPTPENAAQALEAEERHRHVVEYTLGLRAESGKTLNAWKELLLETARTTTVSKLRAGERDGALPPVSDLIKAVGDLKADLANPPAEGVGLLKLIKAAERAAEPMTPKAPGETPVIPEELQSLVGEARKVVQRLRTGDQTPEAFYKPIKAAERAVNDLLRNKAVRKPLDALPPELQALVDKAERVTKRFGGISKEREADAFLQSRGRTAQDQFEIAQSMRGLNPDQAAKVLSRLRGNKPGWFFWLVQQGLISGLWTHSKYAVVNTTQTYLDRVIAPELAAVTQKMLGHDVSLAAPILAHADIIRAVPNALRGAAQAFKSGTRVPLESELRLYARGEESPQSSGAKIPYGDQGGPDWGIWKKVFNEQQLGAATRWLGIPGRSANALHTFYKILNEHASASSIAYEAAHQEGLSPLKDNQKFWQRYDYHLVNPTDDALKQAVNGGYSGTFMERLGAGGAKFSAWARGTKARWVFMFTHIPIDLAHRAVEYSPLAIADANFRNAIMGKNGAAARHLALAKVTIGTAVGGWFIDKTLSGLATGDYPTDPQERKRWAVEGIQPNSIQVDGAWHSMERLGPLSIVGRIAANWATVAQNYQHSNADDETALMTAALGLVLGTAKVLSDEVGFETVKNIVDVLENPHQAARFAAWQIGSYAIWPSSFLSQNASAVDPYMRRAETLLDGLKYRLPYLRETLPAKRDPLYGEPVPNPGYHTIGRSSPVQSDPVKLELDRLHYYPGPPPKRIGHAELTPEQYDRYQATAGPLAHRLLDALVRSPRWQNLPDADRRDLMETMIKAARARAAAALQMETPDLIRQGIDNRRRQILGQ